MSEQDNRQGRPRTSLVDRGWEDIPNAIPDDTMVDPTVDSKELTSPDPSRRPEDMAAPFARGGGASALGLPSASRAPGEVPASAPPSARPPIKPAPQRSAGRPRPSTPPPPPSGRASVPPSAPARPSAPPPPPSQRATAPPARSSTAPPAPKRMSRPPPPEPMVETLSESLQSFVSEPHEAPAPPASPPEVALPPQGPVAPSSLAPTQPSPVRFPAGPAGAAGAPSPEWKGPSSSAAPGIDELPTLQEALAQRVRVGQGAGPLWGFALIAVGLALGSMAVFSGSCSALLTRGSTPAPGASGKAASRTVGAPAPLASEVPAKPRSGEPPTPAVAQTTPAPDDAALKALEARPAAERSVADVLALGAARAADRRRALEDDSAKASQNELYAGSPELSAKLRSASLDPDTMRDALGSMAKLSSSVGADLLYVTWTTRKKTDPAFELAEGLLRTEEVRKKASPALLVALDLRAAESCDAAKDALTRAAEYGDRRVGSLLGRFAQKKGCGDAKKDDCWPCLRDGDVLKNAMKSVGTRAPPKL